MELEQGDVVVQRLAVVVVVDVGGGHPQGLGPRGPVLLSQIVVTNADIDGVTSPDDAEKWELSSSGSGPAPSLAWLSLALSGSLRLLLCDFDSVT